MGQVTAERGAPALRDHEKLGRAELELCAPSAVTEPITVDTTIVLRTSRTGAMYRL